MNESKKTIMYLVKEFEMKKAATAYKRATTNKTGTIDPLKLHSSIPSLVSPRGSRGSVI